MVLHKLVNSTNVVFHMLDLQPYAMVLPMDKTSGEKNKKKILSKVFRNNPDSFAAYKLHMKHLRANNDTSAAGTAVVGPLKARSPEDKADPGDLSPESTKSSETHNEFYPQKHEDEAVDGDASPQNEVSTRADSETSTDSHTNDGFVPNDVTEMFDSVKRFIDRVDTEHIVGCMIILAPKTGLKTSISPVAGGIVEVFDDYERSIQTVWMNNNIRKYVSFPNLKGKKNAKNLADSINDQILAKVVLSTLTLRLCAHAYQMTLPNSKRIQQKSRLISIYHQMGQTFPRFAYSFVREEMKFSKHYEITSVAIKHNDNPRVPCKCLKHGMPNAEDGQEPDIREPNALLFFGITESRFNAMYTSTYEPILIGFMNLLSGKVSDVSKIVHFEQSVANYYEEEDYFKAKRKKINLRSKRLQERV